MIERQTPEVWDILEEVTKGHPVLLNRAPTLHRLSIQAFEPQLIEGEAIRIHPLVCTAYNADFDGDQMAVHVPLSVEAQMEARLLMMAPNNIFSPIERQADHDAVAGHHARLLLPHAEPARAAGAKPNDVCRCSARSSRSDVRAWPMARSNTHDRIRLANPDFGKKTDLRRRRTQGHRDHRRPRHLQRNLARRNWVSPTRPSARSRLGDMIWRCYKICGHEKTVDTLDKLKELGFREATKAGVSIGIDDMIIPKEKRPGNRQRPQADQRSREAVSQRHHHRRRALQQDHRHLDALHATRSRTSCSAPSSTTRARKEFNPVSLMVDSGARGNRQQVRQLAGMRGLMAKPSGEIIERPITSNFREGLTVLEYFISTHGARKGLADTALKTADSGYMTRKLVDVAQDVIINEEDCGTINGICGAGRSTKATKKSSSSATRIIGRVSCETIVDPVDPKKKIVKANQLIDETDRAAIDNARRREGQDSLGAHLRKQARRLRALLRPQSGHRRSW